MGYVGVIVGWITYGDDDRGGCEEWGGLAKLDNGEVVVGEYGEGRVEW